LTLNDDKTFNLSHIYTTNGTYDVTVKVTDDDSGVGLDTAKVTVNSVAPVTPGARINGRILYIVGTARNDHVEVHARGEWVVVRANFLRGKYHTQKFKASDFDRIEITVGNGNDHVRVDKKITKPVTIDGGAGNDHLIAGGGPTKLLGGDGNDKLIGSRVGDKIYGGKGNDIIYGGSGNDMLDGGNGNDKLYGGSGNDLLLGGAGNDLLVGGPGKDTLDGGAGRDRLVDWSSKYKYFHASRNGVFHSNQVSLFTPWVKDFIIGPSGSNNTHNINSWISVGLPPANNRFKGRH